MRKRSCRIGLIGGVAMVLLACATAHAQTPAPQTPATQPAVQPAADPAAQTAIQTPAPATPMRQVDFDAAVAEAIARNPTLAEAATTVDRAEALLVQTRALTRPSLSATASSVTINSARGFDGTITQPQSQATLGIAASAPVLAPADWAAVGQARDQIEVSRLSLATTRQQVGVQAAQAYLSIIAAKRQVDVDERALQAAQAHLDYAQKRLQGGAGSRLNELRAAQEVSSEQSHLETTRLTLRRAQEALGVLMVSDGPVDAAAEPSLETAGPIEESTWMAARPDLRAQNAAVRAADRTVRDSRFDWLPRATASFTPQYVTPAGLFQPSRSWAFTVSFAQPVFDSGERRAARALREVALSQSTLHRTSLEIQARSEVRMAQTAVASAERALASARLAADQADQVRAITTQAFELGASTNIEVIDAQHAALDAATTAAVAEDTLRRARLDLLVALGQFPK